MNEVQEKLRAQIVEKLNATCSGQDKRVHDLLVAFDRFFDNGHSKACALQMVYKGAKCRCNGQELQCKA